MSILNETAEILRLYFIQQQHLTLNGIGSFELRRKPAIFNETSGVFSAPEYSIVFTPGNTNTSKELIVYLSKKKNISEPEAIGQLNDFNKELEARLRAGEAVQWAGIGSLFIKNDQIECIADIIDIPFQSSIVTSPIKASVPEATEMPIQEEVANEEEIEIEEEEPKAKKNVYLLLLAALALALIILSIVQNKGLVTHRGGAVTPAVTPEQYQTNPAE